MDRTDGRHGNRLAGSRSGNTKIRHLHLSILGNDDILRFNIPMYNVPAVGCRNTLGNLDGDTYCFLHIQSPLLGNIAFQRDTLDQFHHNIMKFSLIHDIINTDNIRVRQTGRRLGFHFELADKALIGAEFLFQYFDRHISVQFMAFGFINIRHSTGANQLQDLITFLKIRSCP